MRDDDEIRVRIKKGSGITEFDGKTGHISDVEFDGSTRMYRVAFELALKRPA